MKDSRPVYTPAEKELQLQKATDSNWAGDSEDRRSITGSIMMLGGAPISWQLGKKQPTAALLSCQAEYMAMVEGTKEMLYLHNICTTLGMAQDGITEIYVDNQGAIALTKGNRTHHNRTKHIDIHHHITREQQMVMHQYTNSSSNLAEILMKPLDRRLHERAVTII